MKFIVEVTPEEIVAVQQRLFISGLEALALSGHQLTTAFSPVTSGAHQALPLMTAPPAVNPPQQTVRTYSYWPWPEGRKP